jgi:hypothetical protein
MRTVQIKLEASEQRECVKLEELYVMALAQASSQKAREKAVVESNDARERLREVEAQLVLSKAEIMREGKAREEVQEEMDFQSLVIRMSLLEFTRTLIRIAFVDRKLRLTLMDSH